MKIWILILAFLLPFPTVLFSQEVNIDSLDRVFKTSKVDTIRLNAVYDLINYYSDKRDPAELDYALKAYKIAEECTSKIHLYYSLLQLTNSYQNFNNYVKALQYSKKTTKVLTELNKEIKLIRELQRQSFLNSSLGNYSEAKQNLNKVVELAKKHDLKAELSSAYTGFTAIAFNLGNYAEAIEYCYKNLSIQQQLDNKESIAVAHSNLGTLLGAANEYGLAEENFNEAIEIYEETNDTLGISSIYGKLGSIYNETGKYDSSIMFLNKQIAFAGNKIDPHDLAIATGNLGRNYQKINQFEKALEYTTKALNKFIELNDKRLAAYGYMTLGGIFLDIGNYKASIANANKAIETVGERGEKETLFKSYEILSKAYASIGLYKEAYNSNILAVQLRDSVNNSESNNRIAQLESKHTIEQQEKENELLRAKSLVDESKIAASKEKEKNTKIILIAAVGGITLLLILVFVILKNLRKNKKKNILLNKQKEEIEIKSFQLEEALGDITASINYAKRLQDAILPSKSAMEQIVPQSFVLFKPKDIVSGDFYWMDKSGNKNLVGVFDCTGHGVPGAFMSIVGYNGLNKAVNEQGLEAPNKILDSLHESVLKTMQQDETKTVRDGMDASLCSIDYEKMTLEFAGAMNSLYHISKGEVTEIKGDKMPIGSAEKKSSYTNHKLQIQKGDIVYLFSDGYADQFGGEKGKKFKYRPFRDLLLSVSSEQPDNQLKALETSFQSWMGTYGQVDDVCIIGVKF